MQPCLSSATTMSCDFAQDVANFADAGCPAMEVWLTKLETYLTKHSVGQTQELLSSRGVRLVAGAYQGGLLLSQGAERKVHFDHLRRRLDLCQQFGIPNLIVVPDFASAVDATALERAVVSLGQAAEWAASYQVRLALEFQAKSAWCACVETALSLIHRAGAANLGICFDVFHYYTGPSKFEDLGLLTVDRLFHVQLCDLAGVPREFATDGDRILPGDGDFQLAPILDFLRRLDYRDWISVELMNPSLWQANPQQVVEIGITALRKLLAR
jgi:2-keto-myo-inositol isomerase